MRLFYIINSYYPRILIGVELAMLIAEIISQVKTLMPNDDINDVKKEGGQEEEDKKKKAAHQGNDFFRDESGSDEAGGEGESRDAT